MKIIYQIVTIILLLQGCSIKKNNFVQNKTCPECYVSLKDR